VFEDLPVGLALEITEGRQEYRDVTLAPLRLAGGG
jgi:hypothetical protein